MLIALLVGAPGSISFLPSHLTAPHPFARQHLAAQGEAENEAGRPWIDNYDAEAYGSRRGAVQVAHSQNWSAVQDTSGVLYVANSEGLLAYDGVRWSAIPVGASAATGRRSRSVYSLARLPRGHPAAGQILVGAGETFGVLRPDSLGRMAYDALSDRLPAAEAPIGTVWKTSATTRAAYFLTPERLFRWYGGTLHTWTKADLSVPAGADTSAFAPPDERAFFFSFVVRDTLYVQVRGAGLFRADGDRLRLVPDGTRFAGDGIYALMPHPEGLLVGVRGVGLFVHDGTAARPLGGAVEPWLRTNQLYHGTRLADGTYMLATRQGGAVRMTADGQPLHVLDASVGLRDDKVHYVYEDRAGSVWLALNDGLARVDIAAPYRYYDAALGLAGDVRTLTRHNGTLFAGTTTGLYRLRPQRGGFPRFERVPAFTMECTDLVSTSAGLLVATQSQVAVWQAGQARTVTGAPPTAEPRAMLPASRAAGLVYVGYDDGLRRLRRVDGRWQVGAAVQKVAGPVTGLAMTSGGTLWAATYADGVFRVREPDTDAPVVTRYGLDDGLPVLIDMKVHSVGAQVYFGTRQGLHRFVTDGTGRGRFEPDSTFGADWAASTTFVTHLADVGDSRLWGRAANLTALEDAVTVAPFRRQGDGRWQRGDLLPPVQNSVARALFATPDAVWVGTVGAPPLLRFGPPRQAQQEAAPLPAPLIRRVTLGLRDSLAYGGPTAPSVAVPPGMSELRATFALPVFDHAARPAYRTRLVGGPNAGWTRWDRTTIRRLTGLAPGRYRLEVQARTAVGQRSPVAALPFTVVAPWYRTPWAWTLWSFLGVGALLGLGAGAVRWRTRRLEAQQARLQQQVDAQTAELQAQTAALEAEKQRTAEALALVAEQKEDLAALDAAKSEFFANVSHEFRTPLTLALGLLEEWVEAPSEPLPATARDDLRQVLLNNRRLLRLVNQLLDIARLEAEALTLHVQPLDLGAWLERLAQAFVPLAERRRITFQRDGLDAPVRLVADPDPLETIVANLLSNAFKFTPTGGTVTLCLTADAESARVVVRDTGPGIPADEQKRIFDRFHRAHGEATGTGIGLALAQGLTERHGGRITVDSAPGDGATFTVRLPRGTAHLRDRPDVTWATADDEPARPNLPAPDVADGAEPPANGVPADGAADTEPAPGETPDTRTTVLVVDDNADIRAFVRRHLTPTYRVVEAADGREGLAVALRLTPDCIVSDVMMPEMDGTTLLRALRDDPATDFLPVILLTARAALEDKLGGLEAGADDYLTKPFRPAELITRIRNLIAQRMRLRERFQAEPPAATADEAEEEPPPFLRAVTEAIRAHLSDEDFGVGELATAVGVSRSKLYRDLKAAADASPGDLIWQTRLAEGRQLLEAEEGTVSEVAYGVGFKSVAHFSNRFREAYGVSPSAVHGADAQAAS